MSAQLIRIAFRSQLLGKAFRIAAMFGLLALSAGAADAAIFYTNASQASGATWNSAIWSSSTSGNTAPLSGLTPSSSANDYVVVSGGLIRSTGANTFFGHSVTLNAGGSIRYKNPTTTISFGTTTDLTSGLILSGGTVDPGDSTTVTMTGVITSKADSFVDTGNGTGGTDNARSMDFEALVQGGNKISLVNNGNASTTVALIVGNNGGTVTSTFSGTWDIHAYTLTPKGTNTLGMSAGLGVSTVNLWTGTILNMTSAASSQAIASLTSNTVGDGTVLLGGNTLTINGAGNSTFSGVIQGAGGFLLNRPGGTMVLAGVNNYTGPMNVTSGKLYIDGSTSISSTATVSSGATLGGTGTINGPVNVSSGGIIEAGQAGVGVLTLNGGLNLTGSAAIDFGALASVGSPNLVIAPNTLNTAGNTAAITILNPIPALGSYGLISYNSLQTTASNTFTLASPLPGRAVGALVVNGSELDLNVTVLGTPLIWTGSGNSNWDTTTTNWVLQGSGTTTFIDNPGDSVIFDDTASPRTSVTLNSGTVHPTGVTFNNNTSTYTISGSNAIAGAGGLTVAGSGTVILLNSNAYTGATTVSAGTLQIGNGGSISTASVITDNGTLVFNRSDTVTQGTNFNGAGISGSGSLRNSGAGTLVLNTANGYTGPTTINAGTIQLGAGGTAGSLATTSVITDNGTLAFNRTDVITQGTTFSAGITGSGGVTQAGTGTVVLNGTNNYTGITADSKGTIQFATPTSLYNGNTGSWVPASIIIGSGATLAVNVGGANDFTPTQAATLLSNLSAVSSNGLLAGSTFGLDTTNATAPVTFGASIANSTGTGGGSLNFLKSGPGILTLTSSTNSYTGTTSVTNGELILQDVNSGSGTVRAVNTTAAGTTIISIRSAGALGGGTANSQLAPITLNATGTLLSASILEIGTKIGTDPGGNNADFSYQVLTNGDNTTGTNTPLNPVATNGQINLGFLGNNSDGTGFAAYNSSSLTTPRIVALYTTSSSTTLATIREKWEFGQGTGDHLTLGSPTANNTLILMNPIDLDGGNGTNRRWASIRGVGIAPEGEYAGSIINTSGSANNINFDGNGGLIFDSNATSYNAANIQVNGGAIYVAASDPAQVGVNGALGQGTATLQIGTSVTVNPAGGAVPTNAGAHLGFMTSGPNAGVGPSPTEVTNRNINVGGADVTYASAVLGGVTNDYSAMNGAITLNEPATTPTTFTARNGGRVDFGGTISGIGSVLIDNSIVEGDATTPGIALNNNGTIVFTGFNSYSGPTTVNNGKLYINGGNGSNFANTSIVNVNAGATLGGQGTINGLVTIATGGILEAGQAGVGILTLNSGLTYSGSGTIDFGALNAVGNPSLVIAGVSTLTTGGNTVALDITSVISGTGTFALIGYNGVSASAFTLDPLPNRAIGSLIVTGGNELDLTITSLASIVWTGSANTHWDTASTNWVVQGGGATHYIDSPGDSVIFDDTASPRTNVSINGADVHPTSISFNNNTSTYTISGTNGIAGSTGVSLTGTGTVVLLTPNSYTGATSIASGATLQLGNGTSGNDGKISLTSGITDNGALVYNLSGTQGYAGIIGGAGSVTVKSGAIVLTNANNYFGGTTVSGGTLQLGNGTVGNDGSVSNDITDNGAVVFNYFGSQNYFGTISGSGSVAKTGAGLLTIGPNNPVTGGFTVNGGSLELQYSNPIQNSTVTINPAGTLVFGVGVGSFSLPGLAGSGNLALQDLTPLPVALTVGSNGQNTTFSGIISAAGSLTMNGSGKLTLANANTFTGNTLISSGTIALGNPLALQNSTFDSSGAGTLGYGTLTAATLGGLTSGGNMVLNNTTPAGVALSVGNNGFDTTYSGAMSGSGSLIKIGVGHLTMTGVNTYAGGTNITGGILEATNTASLPHFTTGTVAVGGSGMIAVLLQTTNAPNGWSSGNLASFLADPNVTFAPGGSLGFDVTTGDTVSYPTNLAFVGNANGFGKLGGGTIILTASNTYVGATTITAGTLQLGNGTAGNDGSITSSSNIVNNGALVYNLVNNQAYAGLISGSGSLATNGTSMLTLSALNTFTGEITIGGGTLSIAGDAAVPQVIDPAGITFNGGVLQITAGSAFNTATLSTSRGITINAPVATINISSTASGAFSSTETAVQYRGIITGTGGLTVTGGTNTNSGTAPYLFELGAQNTYGGNTTVSNAILSFNNGFNGGTGPVNILPTTTVLNLVNNGWFDLNNGTANQTISGLNGDSTARLATTNTGLANLTITPSAGSTYTFAGVIGAQTILGKVGGNANFTLTLNGAGGTEILTGSNTYAAATTITAGTLQLGNGGTTGSLAASGTAIIDNDTLAFNRSNTVTQGIDFANIPITGGGGLLQKGPGNLILTAAEAYNGTTAISTGGTLQLGNGGAVGSLSTSSQIIDNGALNFDRGNLVSQGGDFSGGPIGGTGAVIQSGSGTTVLNAANTYSAGTLVTGGTLQLGNAHALGTGGLTANAGVLDLNGFSLTISNSNALPSLAGVAGTITDNSGAGSTTLMDTQSGTTTFGGSIRDGASGTKLALDMNGTGLLNLSGANAFGGGTVVSSGTVDFTVASALPSAGNLVIGSGGDVILGTGGSASPSPAGAPSLAPVPEPSTLGLLAVGALFGLYLRKKRK